MKKIAVALTLAMAFCFASMAIYSDSVLADDVLEQKILFHVKKTKKILQQQVLPWLGSVPKTGQTTSYATGDDGDLQDGTPWPNPRFTDNGDGTLTDNMTRLIWLKNANCFVGTRADALSNCNGLAAPDCGLTDGSIAGDWRLPTVRELYSLIDYGQYDPVLPSGHPFTGVQSYGYWSATTGAFSTGGAWFVFM